LNKPSRFDHRCGVVLLLVVKHGQLRRGMSVQFFNDKERIYNVKQVGFLHPEMVPCEVILNLFLIVFIKSTWNNGDGV